MFLKIPYMSHGDISMANTIWYTWLWQIQILQPIHHLNSTSRTEFEFKTHSHLSSECRTTLTYTGTVAHLQSPVLSICCASSRCACSFLFVLVSVFLIHRAPAVMALGSCCWRAVGSAGIMDREVSNVTADWQLTGGEERDAIAALCASRGVLTCPWEKSSSVFFRQLRRACTDISL